MGHRKMDVKEAQCVNDHRERQRAWEVRREARSRGLQVCAAMADAVWSRLCCCCSSRNHSNGSTAFLTNFPRYPFRCSAYNSSLPSCSRLCVQTYVTRSQLSDAGAAPKLRSFCELRHRRSNGASDFSSSGRLGLNSEVGFAPLAAASASAEEKDEEEDEELDYEEVGEDEGEEEDTEGFPEEVYEREASGVVWEYTLNLFEQMQEEDEGREMEKKEKKKRRGGAWELEPQVPDQRILYCLFFLLLLWPLQLSIVLMKQVLHKRGCY